MVNILSIFKRKQLEKETHKRNILASQDYLNLLVKKVKKKDVNYLMKIGAPPYSIGPPPQPMPGIEPFLASGLRYGSLLLKNLDLLLEISVSRLYGVKVNFSDVTGKKLLERIADYTLTRGKNPYLFIGMAEPIGELKIMAAQGYITGILVTTPERTLTGVDAFLYLEERPVKASVFSVYKMSNDIIEWEDNLYSTRIPGIDRQHKLLADLANHLYRLLVYGATYTQVYKVVKFVDAFMRIHFRTEEILMTSFNYPEKLYHIHLQEHRKFERLLNKYQDLEEEAIFLPAAELLKHLVIWVKDHIKEKDRELGNYLFVYVV